MKRFAIGALLAACSGNTQTTDASGSAWRMGPPLPLPRLEPGVAALGQQLVVVGGFDTDLMAGLDITAEADLLDVASGTWSRLPDAPVRWTHIQLAAIGTTLYLLGGLATANYVPHGDAFALDTLDPMPAWRPLHSMPLGQERGSAAVIVAPPRIYLLGGSGMNQMGMTVALASNLYYDITSDQWGTDLPDLPAPRSHPAGMRRLDGSLIVAGGLATTDSSSAVTDTFLLPPLGTAWQTKMPMTFAHGGCAYGVLQGQLVCAGGEGGNPPGEVFKYNESYNPICDVWTRAEDMPQPRGGTQGAVIGQSLYVPGGAVQLLGFEPTDTLFIYSPLDISP